MILRRPVFLVLAGVVALLTPTALASPPDPTWISGLYDDADYDDAVLAVMGAVASCGPLALSDLLVERIVVAVVSPIATSPAPILPLAASHTRAPPIA